MTQISFVMFWRPWAFLNDKFFGKKVEKSEKQAGIRTTDFQIINQTFLNYFINRQCINSNADYSKQ